MRLLFKSLAMTTAAAAAALALTVPASAAAPAGAEGGTTAQACPLTWSPNPDNYSDDWGYATVSQAGGAPLRSGPYEACGTRATLENDWPMTIYCYYNNDYGNTWFYVSAYPSWQKGWIYSRNVDWTSAVSC